MSGRCAWRCVVCRKLGTFSADALSQHPQPTEPAGGRQPGDHLEDEQADLPRHPEAVEGRGGSLRVRLAPILWSSGFSSCHCFEKSVSGSAKRSDGPKSPSSGKMFAFSTSLFCHHSECFFSKGKRESIRVVVRVSPNSRLRLMLCSWTRESLKPNPQTPHPHQPAAFFPRSSPAPLTDLPDGDRFLP